VFHHASCFFAVTVAERGVHVTVLLWETTNSQPHLPTQQIIIKQLWHAKLHGVSLATFFAKEVAFNATDVAPSQTQMPRYGRHAGEVHATDGTPVYKHHPHNNVLFCRSISGLQHSMKMTVKRVQYSDLLAISHRSCNRQRNTRHSKKITHEQSTEGLRNSCNVGHL